MCLQVKAALLLGMLCTGRVFGQETSEAAAPIPAPEDEKGGLLQSRLEALEEQLGEVKSDTSILKKLKFSGYVQGRYTYADNSRQGMDATGNALVRDGFSVRRGRLKASYTTSWSSYVLQIDAVPSGVSLRDAEVHLIEPWTPYKLTLVVGQTKWPFGYEVIQSSGDREFPERTRVVRAFAPGERDRGAKILAKFGVLRLALGIFDGNGTENTWAAAGSRGVGVDNDQNKDGVGRLGFDLKWISGGISGWYGRTFKPGDYSVTPAVVGKTHPRERVGADLQLYGDLLPIGATALKLEFIAGRTWMRDRVEQFGVPALGWYAVLVQNLGLSNALALRYDHFDGAAGTPNRVDSRDATKPASSNAVGTAGVAFIHYWDDVLKITAACEVPLTGTVATAVDPRDNVFTLQLQAKF
jgi:hypothetical protein